MSSPAVVMCSALHHPYRTSPALSKASCGTSLIVLWLNSGSQCRGRRDSIPGQRTRSHMLCGVSGGGEQTNQPTNQTKSLVKPAVLPAWIPPSAMQWPGSSHASPLLGHHPPGNSASLGPVLSPSGLPTPCQPLLRFLCSKLLVFQNAVPSSSTPLSGNLSNLTPCLPPP